MAEYDFSEITGRLPEFQRDPPLILPLEFAAGDISLRLVTTLTTLGTPIDVSVSEVRIETYFAADDHSESVLRSLAAAAAPGDPLVVWDARPPAGERR